MNITQIGDTIEITVYPPNTEIQYEETKELIKDFFCSSESGLPGIGMYCDDNYLSKSLPVNWIATMFYNMHGKRNEKGDIQFSLNSEQGQTHPVCGPVQYWSRAGAPNTVSPGDGELMLMTTMLNAIVSNLSEGFCLVDLDKIPPTVEEKTTFTIKVLTRDEQETAH